jgi:hypothetical protein
MTDQSAEFPPIGYCNKCGEMIFPGDDFVIVDDDKFLMCFPCFDEWWSKVKPSRPVTRPKNTRDRTDR